MDKQTLMKLLYQQKPVANLKVVTKEGILYETEIIEGATPVWFNVPFNDIGDASFKAEEPAHLLIRYVMEPITA